MKIRRICVLFRWTLHWQPLIDSDLDQVKVLADQIHVDLPERAEVFAEKVRLFPKGCRKVVTQNNLVAYGISHPWRLYTIPPLDDFLSVIPASSDCLYIHDVVVSPSARGNNLASEFIDYIKSIASELGISKLALVSVYGTDVLWSRFGFQEYSSENLSLKLKSYGSSSKYMICDLSHE